MICRRRRLCKYSPAGTNFYKVLQEGKSCYKIVGAFSMVPHRASGHETIWTAEFNNVPPIIIPIGALIYRYNKTDDSWVKQDMSKNRQRIFLLRRCEEASA